MKDTIYEIFPTAIFKTNMNRRLTNKEKKIVDDNHLELNNNFGNRTSKNTYVLEEKNFSSLKKFVISGLKKYYKDVLKVTNNHANSYVSGVLYLNVVEDIDQIVFHKSEYLNFSFNTKETSQYNSNIWKINIQNGDLVLFPSHLQHDVPFRKHNSTRISLAFNSYFKGVVGEDYKLNKLII